MSNQTNLALLTMEQQKSLSTPLQRITVIDALRGFALLGVFISHLAQRFGVTTAQRVQPFPVLDEAVRQLNSVVISGKFIGIFAFLFGLSFFIQMDRAAAKGIDFRNRFLWRMAILFVIGLFGTCFYVNDIIPVYALFGVLLVFLYKVKNTILMVIISLLLLGTPRFIITGYDRLTNPAPQTELVVQSGTGGGRSSVASRTQTVEKSTFFSDAKRKLTTGTVSKLEREFGFSGRAYPTLALFILGFVVGRLRFFEGVHLHKRRNLILFAIFTLTAIVVNQIIALLPSGGGGRVADATLLSLTVRSLGDVYRTVYSGALVMGFIILYHVRYIGRCLHPLSHYGRMGLTNFEMQNVVGCITFSSWGFGAIFGSWGITEAFLLGLAFYAAQIVVSKYWLKYFLYGPFEWFWRSATYLKPQPFRRP
jgi:uncharacterized protein